ncbi:MAG: cob(I)yrinic acid a,c-diamide adenosyltransferase [Paludibacteraceae bacterium]|nr:cob(I)yrinic acid a,c-diamide adenosyltransferase [Paludibacteraceae bacterium]
MAIYTKTGDKGQTSLASGQRVEKTDVRIEAYGTVDELNSWVGMLRASMTNSQEPIANSQLEWVQNKLFNLGAALSEAPGEWIVEEDVTQLEQWIDAIQAVVPPQRAFLLPSGSETVCRCHVCRTVCRRAERRMLDAQADEKALRFINRLSDYLFVLSRHIAYSNNEIENMWKK